jgi:hypothetical protein
MIHHGQTGSIPELKEEVRLLERKQRKLIESISDGTIKTKAANSENREITKELSRYAGLLEIATTISEAESTENLGSLIELSFEEYRSKLDLEDELEEFVAPEKKSGEFNSNNVAILVLIGIVAWAGWTYYAALGKASWKTEVLDHKQFIQIRCENTGDKSIRVYAPWPDGKATNDSPSKLRRISYGLLLYVREKGKSNFQLLPESPGVWLQNGEPRDSSVPIIVRSGDRIDIKLDILKLRQLGISIEAVKVEYTRQGGRKVGGHEISVP